MNLLILLYYQIYLFITNEISLFTIIIENNNLSHTIYIYY